MPYGNYQLSLANQPYPRKQNIMEHPLSSTSKFLICMILCVMLAWLTIGHAHAGQEIIIKVTAVTENAVEGILYERIPGRASVSVFKGTIREQDVNPKVPKTLIRLEGLQFLTKTFRIGDLFSETAFPVKMILANPYTELWTLDPAPQR